MAIQKRTLILLCLGLVASNLLTVVMIQYYTLEIETLEEIIANNESEISVSLCLDYQEHDGSIEWYNNTKMPSGSNLWQLINLLADVEAKDDWVDTLGSHYITAINGVEEDVSEAHHWMWTYWDDSENKWVYGTIGADMKILSDGEIIRWRFENPYTSGWGG